MIVEFGKKEQKQTRAEPLKKLISDDGISEVRFWGLEGEFNRLTDVHLDGKVLLGKRGTCVHESVDGRGK